MGFAHREPGTGQALTLHIHRALLCRAQVTLLLRHDDVLDVLHGQVLTEGVIEQTLQLIHGQLLHVTLRGGEHNAMATDTTKGPTLQPWKQYRLGAFGPDLPLGA